jgi:serine/threonine-protein kinase
VLVLEADLNRKPDDALMGTVVGGKFPVVGLLGEGGFGAVYRAVQDPVGRQVALKVMRAGEAADPETRARFFREARVVASLSHPAIVMLHDYGEQADGLIYIAFELVAGRPLSGVIRDDAPMAPSRAVHLLVQVLGALSEAHTAGLLHRDMKPDNLMVVQGTLGEEKLRLLDFGLSKRFNADTGTDSLATRQGIIMGTPRYMSPEQASGRSIDGRSDLYACGVLLYEMLSGRPPFTQTSPLDLLMAHIGEAVPPLPASLGLPPALVSVVMKALTKSPDARWQTAAELASALQAAVSGEAVAPAPAARASATSDDAFPAPNIASLPTLESAPVAVLAAQAGLAPLREPSMVAQAPNPKFGEPSTPVSAPSLGTVRPPEEAPPMNARRGPPIVLIAVAAVLLLGGLGWLLFGGSAPEAPAPSASDLSPVRQVVSVGGGASVAPPSAVEAAPGTRPIQPWERALAFAEKGKIDEAAAQLHYLMRGSKNPREVYERAKADARLAAVVMHPIVQSALPPSGAPTSAP